MHAYLRPVRFEDVDAAGIVFFARFLTYGHEAMESLLAGLEGGYVHLINGRRIGMPAVHVECDFRAPLRFGDVARIEVTVPRISTRSCTYHYHFVRDADGVDVAGVTHVCAVTDLTTFKAVPVPDDVRLLLALHAG